MYLRDMAERLLERCANCFSDPAERLQFLQQAAVSDVRSRGNPRFAQAVGWALARHDFARKLFPAAGLAILIAIALAVTVVQGSSRRPAISRSVSPVNRQPERLLSELPNAEAPALPPRVWLVEETQGFDLYSNGLRVEDQFATATGPRKYFVFARNSQDRKTRQWR
jgi:hypothetical protein